MSRTFVLASAYEPEGAARAAAAAPRTPDLCVISPSAAARRTSGFAVGGRWVFTVEEPLLAPQAPGETGADVLARLARALRAVQAFDAHAPLIVCDGLDILGASTLALDEHGLMRLADDLERALPLP
jgi:hypothetical protein